MEKIVFLLGIFFVSSLAFAEHEIEAASKRPGRPEAPKAPAKKRDFVADQINAIQEIMKLRAAGNFAEIARNYDGGTDFGSHVDYRGALMALYAAKTLSMGELGKVKDELVKAGNMTDFRGLTTYTNVAMREAEAAIVAVKNGGGDFSQYAKWAVDHYHFSKLAALFVGVGPALMAPLKAQLIASGTKDGLNADIAKQHADEIEKHLMAYAKLLRMPKGT